MEGKKRGMEGARKKDISAHTTKVSKLRFKEDKVMFSCHQLTSIHTNKKQILARKYFLSKGIEALCELGMHPKSTTLDESFSTMFKTLVIGFLKCFDCCI